MTYYFSDMLTKENRPLYDRSHLRHESDLTDAEWALVAPLIPPARHGGAHRTEDARSRQRASVNPEHQLPMAGDPQRPAAAQHTARLS